ncbi:MAG: hypothetical protein DRJ03_23370 [Chloroflexi bacterium]|nr:MAG: hypothetical protein DRJ03_23370 [Chloroflexota bacterium]
MNNTNYPSQPAPSPLLLISVWGATDKGRQREGNEDSVYPHSSSDTFPFKPGPDSIAQKGHLLVVADGVGGAKGGAEASRWAIRVAVERYYDQAGPDLGTDLRTAIEMANSSLYQYLQSTGVTQAGSTMVAAVIHGNTLQVANVGDSRAYLIREGQITKLTRDHTLTQQKIDRGIIQPEQAAMDPDSSVLTRSMGAGPTVQADLFQPVPLTPGDVVLLCSDGLTDMVEEAEIVRLTGGGSPKRMAQRLIAAANKQGGVDNISVAIAQAGGKQAAAGGELLANIPKMKQQQKIILGGMAGLVALVFCSLVAWAAWGAITSQGTPTPSAPTAETPAATTTAPIVATNTPQPSEPTQSGQSTSTPAPTFTPSPTPLPDSDGDGIANIHDQCINLFGLQQFDGCPDDDGDTIPEREDGSGDQCPNWPGLPDHDGCPDNDADGFPEREDGSGDQCPNEPGPLDGCPAPNDGGGGGDGGGDGGGAPDR